MELNENEVRVLRALRDAGGPALAEEVGQKTGLADSAIARATLTLTQKGLAKEQTRRTVEVFCTEEGHDYLANGLPERRVATAVLKAGGRLAVSDAVEEGGLSKDFVPIVTGWIARKGWGIIQKTDSSPVLVVSKNPTKDNDEELLERVGQVSVPIDRLPSELKQAAESLLKRNILASKERVERKLEITPQGLQAIPDQVPVDEVSSLSSEMILSGDWERTRLRTYNVSSPVPNTNPGKYHPYLRFLRAVKRKLVALGFREVAGPLVETSFINDDCLYMPQDHPAREIHDLYYLKRPATGSLQHWKDLLEKVALTHENGWKTGSTGWGYKYSREEASKLVLRSHGTALSVRSMISKDLRIPGKYFAIA
ncbi:MAG TPA: hypothetical protein VFE96_03640, partial [Candidatus Bathyarchaeia archaeon]|nr:hypothetical protein [Candidatus Bathyarchaeia archaeon]